ncbi:hypothetical protein BT63DRAFT_455662 [Microthyrium microscopicum]|uniref:Uncharacterized protein n=1 Tax=Microthyrium microscopicum TaxID=703497 RepID=A0A6A6UBP3_9PEZI|nr:hypothetical protein BT63DRAFT_455662 [Microthyrium microscopicum]
MPVRWTPELDQVLFIKYLESHSPTINYDAIIEIWPKNLTQPTKKALTEHISKIRKDVKKTIGENGNVVASPAVAKPRAPRKSGGAKATPKRAAPAKKRKADDSDDSEDDDMSSLPTTQPSPSPEKKLKSTPKRSATIKAADKWASAIKGESDSDTKDYKEPEAVGTVDDTPMGDGMPVVTDSGSEYHDANDVSDSIHRLPPDPLTFSIFGHPPNTDI